MRVNYADGRTAGYELAGAEGEQAWAAVQADPDEQANIRGVVLDGAAQRVAVQAPRQFQVVTYAATLDTDEGGAVVGESVQVQADDVRLTVTLLKSGMVRVLLARPGKARHLTQFTQRNRRSNP